MISIQWRAFSTQLSLTLVQESLTHSREGGLSEDSRLLEDLQYTYNVYLLALLSLCCDVFSEAVDCRRPETGKFETILFITACWWWQSRELFISLIFINFIRTVCLLLLLRYIYFFTSWIVQIRRPGRRDSTGRKLAEMALGTRFAIQKGSWRRGAWRRVLHLRQEACQQVSCESSVNPYFFARPSGRGEIQY